jgi:hypothetical protein
MNVGLKYFLVYTSLFMGCLIIILAAYKFYFFKPIEKPNPEFRITGFTYLQEGNCSPMLCVAQDKCPNTCTKNPTSSKVIFTQPTKDLNQLRKVAQLNTDNDGFYSVMLKAGNYSMLGWSDNRPYCNKIDANGIQCPVTITSEAQFDVVIDKATY